MTLQAESYPNPSFLTLAVRNLASSTSWYQKVLGFQLAFSMYDADSQLILTHLRWAQQVDLLLVPDQIHSPTSEPKGLGVTLTFTILEGSVDDLARAAVPKGASMTTSLVVQPWSAKAVVIADPDDYQLLFAQYPSREQRSVLDPAFIFRCRQALAECI